MEPMLKECDISNNNSQNFLKSRGKYVQVDLICYWQMRSFMTLDGVTLFLRLKDIKNTCK